MPILQQNVTLDMTKTQVSLVRCPAWSYFVMAVPGMRLHPPWVTTKRQLQRLLFGDNVIHDNNNYTMYIPHDTFHISLTFIYTYVQVTSPQPPHIDGPHVTDGNPKIAGKWCIMFEFKFNHFNQRQFTARKAFHNAPSSNTRLTTDSGAYKYQWNLFNAAIFSADTWRNTNVIITSKIRRNVVLRNNDVIITSCVSYIEIYIHTS